MAAPTAFVWDSNQTHTLAVTGTHQTDGYVSGEVPLSSELNAVLNLIGLWIQYFAGLTVAQYRYLSASIGHLDNSATVDGTSGGVKSGGALSGASNIPLAVSVGDIISGIGITCIGDGTHNVVTGLVVLNGDGTVTTVSNVLDSPVIPPASWGTVTRSITPITVAAGKSYSLFFYWNAGTTEIVQSIGANIQRATG